MLFEDKAVKNEVDAAWVLKCSDSAYAALMVNLFCNYNISIVASKAKTVPIKQLDTLIIF